MGVRTLVETGSWYWQTMVGSSLSWFDVPIHGCLILVLTVCLFLSVFPIKNEKEVFITKKQKLWIGTIIFCGVVLIILSMLTWTDVGSKLFQGVQGRYFLPILPLFLLLFRGKGLFWKNIYYYDSSYYCYSNSTCVFRKFFLYYTKMTIF